MCLRVPSAHQTICVRTWWQRTSISSSTVAVSGGASKSKRIQSRSSSGTHHQWAIDLFVYPPPPHSLLWHPYTIFFLNSKCPRKCPVCLSVCLSFDQQQQQQQGDTKWHTAQIVSIWSIVMVAVMAEAASVLFHRGLPPLCQCCFLSKSSTNKMATQFKFEQPRLTSELTAAKTEATTMRTTTSTGKTKMMVMMMMVMHSAGVQAGIRQSQWLCLRTGRHWAPMQATSELLLLLLLLGAKTCARHASFPSLHPSATNKHGR